jgi:hypothetical protein
MFGSRLQRMATWTPRVPHNVFLDNVLLGDVLLGNVLLGNVLSENVLLENVLLDNVLLLDDMCVVHVCRGVVHTWRAVFRFLFSFFSERGGRYSVALPLEHTIESPHVLT